MSFLFVCLLACPASTKKEAKRLASRNTIARFVRCYSLEGIEARISDRKTNKRPRSSIYTMQTGTAAQGGAAAPSGLPPQSGSLVQHTRVTQSGGMYNIAAVASMVPEVGPRYQAHIRPEDKPIKIYIPILKFAGEFETVIYEASETHVPDACVQDLLELARDDKVVRHMGDYDLLPLVILFSWTGGNSLLGLKKSMRIDPSSEIKPGFSLIHCARMFLEFGAKMTRSRVSCISCCCVELFFCHQIALSFIFKCFLFIPYRSVLILNTTRGDPDLLFQ